ncbi:hypothetical protein Fcan01_28185 [Folsomia candida]|uniref:Uncharacterized protein n=1 Tax=Folsomia candida TaxID=158441 RepID=A0A226CWX2_FOLCA|nr:hypothetical protein Fcan01_28185 [Folsomia candida]
MRQHSSTPNHLRHLQSKGFTWASSSFRNNHAGHDGQKPHATQTHDNFTHADAMHLHIYPVSTVSRAFNATTTPSTPKIIDDTAEEELHMASMQFRNNTRRVSRSSKHNSIHEGSVHAANAFKTHTPLTGNACGGLPLADTTATHCTKSMTISLTLCPASSHSPGSTVSRAFNATTTPSTTKIIYTPAEQEAFTWASSSFETHTDG